MLDIKFIRDNIDAVRTNIEARGVRNADVDRVVTLYADHVAILQRLETARKERNETSQKMKGKLEQAERDVLIARGKELKEEIAGLEERIAAVDAEYDVAIRAIPNMTHPDVPVGGEDDAREIARYGEPTTFDFEPKDHLTLGADLNILDFETAAEVSGAKFYYLKNDGALLELALVNYALGKVAARGYAPHLTPDLARADILDAIGFNPRGEETQVYRIEGSDLCLIGTAEITLGGMLKGKVLPKEELPVRMGGFSHCFRTEAGAHGAYTKGLYRVHQFSKVEMFAFTHPDVSQAAHEEMRDIEVEIFRELGIPFRVIDIATGDLGAPAFRKYDLEAWMPSRDGYGEVTSTSNCTDYQSRRLNIRFRDAEGNLRFVHTLNGTAIAVPRTIVAILENFQQADGSVIIPEVLRPFMGGRREIRAKG